MIAYSSAVTIGRPPSEVFRYLVELERQALWSDVPMRLLTDPPFGAGTRMRLAFGRGPLQVSLDLEVSALEQDRRMAFKTVSNGGILWDGEYLLEPAGPGGTTISQAGRLRFRGLWRLLEPMIGREIRSAEIKELERMKVVAEAGR